MLGEDQMVEALERGAWSMYGRFGRGPGALLTDTPTRLLVGTPVSQPPYNTVFRFLDVRYGLDAVGSSFVKTAFEDDWRLRTGVRAGWIVACVVIGAKPSN